MKLTKTLHKFKTQLLTKLPSDVYATSLLNLAVLILIAALVWFAGPQITWEDYIPLASSEKRIYIIACLFLLWLLKFLIIDLDAPNPFQYKDIQTRKKLQILHSRFRGALAFLRKTKITKNNKNIHLNQLPWYLLLGPTHGGKTSLLANANVNFILQRQFPNQDIKQLEPSENCDWWVTREACLIDVPGKYLTVPETQQNQQKPYLYPVIWRYFLRLIKKQRGNNGISGIIIVLPLAEIMRQSEQKKYQLMLRNLFQRIYELQKMFPHSLPCQIILTKCDLLPGFNEFFAEAADDEIHQAWGITIPLAKNNEKPHDIFAHRFGALIKRLNQQLLWRLHQERNPMARPYIKDFPLQIERLKEFTSDFIKKLSSANLALELKSVYLTSALQVKPEAEEVLDQPSNNNQRSIQLFQQPGILSRPHFIKQLITHGINQIHSSFHPKIKAHSWKRRTAFAASASLIILTGALLGRDFEKGVQHTYAVQTDLANYQLAIQKIQNPDEHLAKTLQLLNTLKQSADATKFKLDLAHIFSFYSQKSEQKIGALYDKALQSLLIPEIKLYLTEYLKNPVNKNNDYVYAALKAYLMLNDSSHFEAGFIANTMQEILPKSLTKLEADDLIKHVQVALTTAWAPIPIDEQLVQETRKYFSVMPDLQLGYIILKNINSNSAEREINLGLNTNDKPIFTSRQLMNEIPFMFTSASFANIVSSETTTASQEAILGNWVLGNHFGMNKNPEQAPQLMEQLRTSYINNYIDVWERLINNIHLTHPKNLAETDELIINLISSDSPLLQMLNTLHDNTYFEPILSTSSKLQSLGALVDKHDQSDQTLYQIFTTLQNVHQLLQSIMHAENEKKAAFDTLSNRMLNQNSPDILMQLRIIGEKSPEPIKNWLDKISDYIWRYLIQDAGHYIDTSWQEQVGRAYQSQIANRYPFGTNNEVDAQKFIAFFGNPGTIMNFYNSYLHQFIDTSTADWHWKSIDNQKLPFSDETLRQVQQAMRIHQAFFPNGDNKLLVQFSLMPQKFGKEIKSVQLTFNDKKIMDVKTNSLPHLIAWSGTNTLKHSSIQLTLANHKNVSREFPGNWGWHKLISQAFESTVSNKNSVINLSQDEQPAKYLLTTEGQINPFFAINLRRFHLPLQITEKKA